MLTAALAGALVAFLVSAGWFVVLTLLWPASSRPYIAGSTDAPGIVRRDGTVYVVRLP